MLAHQYLQTNDKEAYQAKFTSARLPFQREYRREEGKLDDYSHKPYDQSKKLVPSPRMGGKVMETYDTMIQNHFHKKAVKQEIAERKIVRDQKLA